MPYFRKKRVLNILTS